MESLTSQKGSLDFSEVVQGEFKFLAAYFLGLGLVFENFRRSIWPLHKCGGG